MTLKSAFHPIIGDKIFGWMGDTLDVLSVATTLFGVCTSLGLGVKQLNAGFARLNPTIGVNDVNQSIIIWAVTALATASVVSGIRVGIRRISEVNFLIGQFLLLIVFFQEDSWYLLNNLTQSIAFYVQVAAAVLPEHVCPAVSAPQRQLPAVKHLIVRHDRTRAVLTSCEGHALAVGQGLLVPTPCLH